MTAANLASILQGAADSHRWERLLSGEGGGVLDLQFGEGTDILAVSRLGLFRSVDNGEHWVRIEAPPLIQTLHRSGDWWLGTDFGLFRTDSLDGSWEPVLVRTAVIGVSVGEQSDLVLAASMERGLLRSEDGGKTWDDANPGLPGDDIVAIHRSPAFERDQTIFVATESGLFRSRNGGRAWRHVPLVAEDIQCFAILGNQLLVGTDDDGLWLSADAGRTWHQSLPGEAIRGFGASTAGRAVVLSDSTLHKLSADGGNLIHSSLPPDALCAIETGNRMLVGTIGSGVLRQMSEGGGWEESSHGLHATARDRVRAIGNSRIVSTSRSGAILHSADGGASWSELPDAPLGSVYDFDARVDAINGLEIVACDGRMAGIYRTSWQRLEAESPLAVAWLDRDPAMLTGDGHFVCGEFRSSLLSGGHRLIGARLYPVRGRPASLWSVLHTDHAGVIVMRSPDGGKQWKPLLQADATSAVSLAVTIDTSGSEVALVAVGNRIYRVLESPEAIWTGDDGTAIAEIAVCPDKCILIATNRGLFAASQDFATSELVSGSPAPLLDIDIDSSGDAIAVERGGSIWRLGRAQAARYGRPLDSEGPRAVD